MKRFFLFVTILSITTSVYSAPSDFAVLSWLVRESMEKALLAVTLILSLGITVTGIFKGYSYLKQGINKA